jgi:lipopolysaccharide assembly outer membrane protein LptD (OstA)
MVIYIDDDYSEILGQVQGFRDGKPTTNKELDERERAIRLKPTYLTCNYLKYINKDENTEMEFKGNIHIYQDDKSVWGNEGYYNSKEDLFYIKDMARFTANNLDWAIKKKQKDAFKNGDIKKAIKKPLTVYADKIMFDSKGKVLRVLGNVHIAQQDKDIYCSKLELLDKENLLKLFGPVQIVKENGDKLKCSQLIVDLNKETFQAESGIESEFKIKKDKKKR